MLRFSLGSQSDLHFLEKIKNKIPKIDILIDDGGHFMEQQITTFNVLLAMLKMMEFIYAKIYILVIGFILEEVIKEMVLS